MHAFESAIRNFRANPLQFLVRQILRVILFWPWQLCITVIAWLFPARPERGQTPSTYCFIITSTIYVKSGTIQYQSPRSIFTASERATQTLETIRSIRHRVPGAKIVLVEAGLQKQLPENLNTIVDEYIYVGGKPLVKWAVGSIYKSLGELMLLAAAAGQVRTQADFYFKISGRYQLSDSFHISDYASGRFVLQYIQPDYVCTRLYGWRSEAMRTWRYAVLKSLPLAATGYAVENTLAKFIPRAQVHTLSTLGVVGIGASTNVTAND